MNASIIIPTYNKLPRLKLTLASIRNQSFPKERFEVIIIDNGSSDGTAEYLKKVQLPYRWRYVATENIGRAVARNVGIGKAAHELVIFIDDDLVLSSSFIEEHIRLQTMETRIIHGQIMNLPFLKFFQDPSTGVFYQNLKRIGESGLAKKCLTEKDIADNFSGAVISNSKMTAFEAVIKGVLSNDTSDAAWLGFTGGNTSVPKKWLDMVGGFDENFGLDWGCEDLELGYRLFSMGYKFYYADNAVN